MRVQFRSHPPSPASPREAQLVAPEVRFPFTSGREYEVYAVSVYDGVVFVLVIDDSNAPWFTPRALFETVDATVPARWICNVFATGPVPMILGPEFIARDLASYDRFIDCDGEQMTAFWKMVEADRRLDEPSGEGDEGGASSPRADAKSGTSAR